MLVGARIERVDEGERKVIARGQRAQHLREGAVASGGAAERW